MSKCPKCGAEECFRSSAYVEWQCWSADDFGEFVEEDKCLRNQLAQAKEEIEELRKHNTQLDEENATLDELREAVEELRDECRESMRRHARLAREHEKKNELRAADAATSFAVMENHIIDRLTHLLEAADAE